MTAAVGLVARGASTRNHTASMTFERTVLPSGVRVVTQPVAGQRTASIGVWSPVGSRGEPAPLAGVGHFLEHLVFKGTSRRSALAIAQQFDAVGGDLNAFTGRDHTCFYARVLGEDASEAIDTIADMVRNATLANDDVEAERGVVLEEISLHEDTPDDLVFDLFSEALWPEHGLGRRVEGYAETVAAMTRDDLLSTYRSQYGEIVVAAAGNVEHARVVDWCEDAFGAGQAWSGPTGDVASAVGALTVRRRDVEQAHIVYGVPGIPRNDARRWALAVLNVALGGGMSSRLFQEIRERQGLAYAVSSDHQGFAETGLFTIYAGCSPNNVGEVLRRARAIVDEVASEGIHESELERAVGHLRGSILMSLDEPGALMSHLGRGELLYGEVLSGADLIARLTAVTLEDVREVAGALFCVPWSLAVLGPKIDDDGMRRFLEGAA